MRTLDFSLDKYKSLCHTLLKSQYKILTVFDYFRQNLDRSSHFIILRHDVDRKPSSALSMARLEQSLGVASTYYFRVNRTSCNENIIKQISGLGHEIGYHYETLTEARGNFNIAINRFEDNLKHFRKIAEIRTISMHGSPFSKWNNSELWNKYKMSDFDIAGDANLSIDYSDIVYFTDTGRSWHPGLHNIRDKVDSGCIEYVKNTDELIGKFENRLIPRLCLLAHPERWSNDFIGHMFSYSFDYVVNILKRMVRR